MRMNGWLVLLLMLLLVIARLGLIAVTIRPGENYWDHPIVPMVMGGISGLALRDRPRSTAGAVQTFGIALAAVVLTEVTIALLVVSQIMDISGTNLLVIMLAYWTVEPAYLLFSVFGVLLAVPVYWSRAPGDV